MRADAVFERFVGKKLEELKDVQFPRPRNFECLKASMKQYETSCEKFTDYSLVHVKHLVMACETMNTPLEFILKKIDVACQ